MLLAGLASLAGLEQADVDQLAAALPLGELAGAATLERRSVQGISGWGMRVELPDTLAQRTLADILALIEASGLSARAKKYSREAFTILAQAEASVHGADPGDIHFHEVGALDSILDTCLASALFDRLSPSRLVCGPLPVCDGMVRCSHGLLPAPAPATLKLLEGVPVYGIPSSGETVTPTAISLLKAFGATFGNWPAMTVQRQTRAYGTRVLPGVPNGAVFVWGEAAAQRIIT